MTADQMDKQLVLIVDDIVENLQVLGNVLKNDGHRVAFARSGEQALEFVAHNKPDLILLDIMMPGMDGYEVCNKIKELPDAIDIPIIFVTALRNIDNEYKGFEIGGVDYITKPFNGKIVSARVKTHLQLRRKTILLEKMVSIDGLTEIYNRRRFDETIENEWKRAKRNKAPLSLILMDIDFFKNYNDTYGHSAGDECLRQVAQAIKTSVHRPADLAARYGGEEFAVILPETKIEDAAHIAESIRENIISLQIPHKSSGTADHVTLSLGVSTFIPNEKLTTEDLVTAADKNLYRAKKEGRNRVKSNTQDHVKINS